MKRELHSLGEEFFIGNMLSIQEKDTWHEELNGDVRSDKVRLNCIKRVCNAWQIGMV